MTELYKPYSAKRWRDNIFEGAKVSGEAKKLTLEEKKEKEEFIKHVLKKVGNKNSRK